MSIYDDYTDDQFLKTLSSRGRTLAERELTGRLRRALQKIELMSENEAGYQRLKEELAKVKAERDQYMSSLSFLEAHNGNR